MKKILDVNLQRKIRRKKLKKRYIKVILLFLSFFVILLVVWNLSLKKLIFDDEGKNFPILFLGDCVINFKKTKSGFCVLTNNQLNFYSKKGALKRSILNSSFNSNVSCSEDKVLWFEKGAKNFSIQTQDKVLFSDILSNNIIFGKIFKNGGYAFVTESEDFYCEFLVYDKENKQIFRWALAESLISDFDVYDDLNGCLIALTTFKDGFCKTSLCELNFSNSNEVFKKDFEKLIPIAVKKSGNIIILVCDNKVFFIDEKGSVLNEIEFEKNIINYVITSSGYLIVCFSSLQGGAIKNVVVSYDKFGNKLAEKNLEERVVNIKENDGNILIATDNLILKTNVNFKKMNILKDLGGVYDFVNDGPYFYYISMNKINRVLFK